MPYTVAKEKRYYLANKYVANKYLLARIMLYQNNIFFIKNNILPVNVLIF
jgi:hypothetical protein